MAQTIEASDISKYVGKTVTVYGKIYDGKYLSKLSSKPTLLDFGGIFPNQLATIFIEESHRINFNYKPEEFLKSKIVWVTGRVSIFNDQYRITVFYEKDIKVDTTIIFTKADVEAQYPGGLVAWKNYLEENVNPHVPVAQGLKPGHYTVKIQFVVAIDGSVYDVKAVEFSNGCTACISDAIRVIKQSPRWIPAMQNGISVIYQAVQYITYEVSLI